MMLMVHSESFPCSRHQFRVGNCHQTTWTFRHHWSSNLLLDTRMPCPGSFRCLGNTKSCNWITKLLICHVNPSGCFGKKSDFNISTVKVNFVSTVQCRRPWHCMCRAKEMQQSQERPRDFLPCLLCSQHTASREKLAHEILSDLGYALTRAGFLHCWSWRSGVPLCFLLWFRSHSRVLLLEIVAGFYSLTKGRKSDTKVMVVMLSVTVSRKLVAVYGEKRQNPFPIEQETCVQSDY